MKTRCLLSVIVFLSFLTPAQANRIKSVSSGYTHGCILFEDGKIKCWGNNEYGQLGIGDKKSRGTLPNQMGEYLKTVDLGQDVHAIKLATGGYHNCALLSDGTVKCWGYNEEGELGLGDKNSRGDAPGEMGDQLPRVDLGEDLNVIKITAGANHSCALLSDNTIKCWGYNNEGQLGLGDMQNRGESPNQMGENLATTDLGEGRVIDLEAGGGHSCALFEGGSVKCWGYNRYGQLGLGENVSRGSAPGQMGEKLSKIDLGKVPVSKIVVGGEHSCALLADQTLKCWGRNQFGQLGIPGRSSYGNNRKDMGENLKIVNLGVNTKVLDAVAGFFHTCAKLGSKAIKCWGSNGEGELGLGDVNSRGDDPNEMGDFLTAFHVEPGLPSLLPLRLGWQFSCFLVGLVDQVKCLGRNSSGELGYEDRINRGDTKETLPPLLKYLDLGSL